MDQDVLNIIPKTQAEVRLSADAVAWLEGHLRARGYKAAPFHLRQAKLSLDQALLSLEQAKEQIKADKLADAQLAAGAKALTEVGL